MTGTPLYRVLADAFEQEGVDTLFVLTGDGNMHWEAAYAEKAGTRTFHVRHEHCACAMASAYAEATGNVGVASVTCGPGLTQIMTALATAVQGHIPLVVFTGESPLHASWYNQALDQGPLVTATGAHYIQAHSLKRMQEHVAEAFLIARTQRRPVVLGVPLDIQQTLIENVAPYRPSTAVIPDTGPRVPHPDYLKQAADRVRAAKRVVVLGGRGAKRSGAAKACARLAELCNGALAATLPVRGLFAGNARDIGVAGGFSHQAAREVFEASDLVIAVGASVTSHTSDSNKLFAATNVIQIDDAPTGIRHGRLTADLFLTADALTGVEALIAELEASGYSNAQPGWDVPAFAKRVRSDPPYDTVYPVPQGTLDPRAVITALDRGLPKDWAYVNASGHCSFFSAHLHDRSAENFLTIREFGAIGNGLCYAVGMAAARPDLPVALIDGDGGLMMHAQELETVRRYGLKLLMCILNDGAFGSEIHKLRADGLDDHGAIYGRNDLARMADGFGIRGEIVTDAAQLPGLIAEFERSKGAMLLDIQISDQVMSPMMARSTRR